ncbi:MAG: FAD-dependent oxidoreductase [Pseudomonadota bacterium]|nr:FAD-dependent oxidoreductase [Pseudomonadota bacterium]
MQDESSRKEIVLVGGGHAHVEVVRRFGRRPEPGGRITLVARDPLMIYSGMLPGLVAGHYRPDDCHIDLPALCDACRARFIHAEATGIDRAAKRLLLADGPPLAYGLLSLDVGITPLLDEIEGAAEHALAVKPIGAFLPKWQKLLRDCRSPDGPRKIVAVGGGAAGFELILALKHRLTREAARAGLDASRFSFALVTGGGLLEEQNAHVRRAVRRALARHGVEVLENSRAAAIDRRGVRLESGGFVAADAALVSTHATAPHWLAATGLSLDENGFVAIGRTLQTLNDPDVFAAGDCASMVEDPRPKAGVFAVRQGPPLAENLRRRSRNEPPAPYRPQRRWLSLLSTGEKYAIAGRAGVKLEGAWVWRWKDHVDRRWMRRYRGAPP